jgi:hypothetical protein
MNVRETLHRVDSAFELGVSKENMRKLIVPAAMLAMMLVAAAPLSRSRSVEIRV